MEYSYSVFGAWIVGVKVFTNLFLYLHFYIKSILLPIEEQNFQIFNKERESTGHTLQKKRKQRKAWEMTKGTKQCSGKGMWKWTSSLFYLKRMEILLVSSSCKFLWSQVTFGSSTLRKPFKKLALHPQKSKVSQMLLDCKFLSLWFVSPLKLALRLVEENQLFALPTEIGSLTRLTSSSFVGLSVKS